MNNRIKNTRVVKFEEDFNPSGKKVLYAKDSEHAIHVKLVEKLQTKKVKMKVSKFDFDKAVEKAQKQLEKNKKV